MGDADGTLGVPDAAGGEGRGAWGGPRGGGGADLDGAGGFGGPTGRGGGSGIGVRPAGVPAAAGAGEVAPREGGPGRSAGTVRSVVDHRSSATDPPVLPLRAAGGGTGGTAPRGVGGESVAGTGRATGPGGAAAGGVSNARTFSSSIFSTSGGGGRLGGTPVRARSARSTARWTAAAWRSVRAPGGDGGSILGWASAMTSEAIRARCASVRPSAFPPRSASVASTSSRTGATSAPRVRRSRTASETTTGGAVVPASAGATTRSAGSTILRVSREMVRSRLTSSPFGPSRYGWRRTSCELPRNFSTPIARTVCPSSSQRNRRTSPRARVRSGVSTSSSGASTVRSTVAPRSERNLRNVWAVETVSSPFMQKYCNAVSESITIRAYLRRGTSARSICSSAATVTSTLVNSGLCRISIGTPANGMISRTLEMSLNGAFS